jgi:hypothetical protein
MRRSLGLVGLLLAGLVVFGSACSCDSFCSNEAEQARFTGELLSADGRVLTFAGPDGPRDVYVEGNEYLLDVGTTYRVTALRNVHPAAEWATHINGGCGCQEINITHEDGVRVNTGLWARVKHAVPFGKIAIAILAIPVLTMTAVSVNRARDGRRRHIGTDDLPFDEWVDIED